MAKFTAKEVIEEGFELAELLEMKKGAIQKHPTYTILRVATGWLYQMNFEGHCSCSFVPESGVDKEALKRSTLMLRLTQACVAYAETSSEIALHELSSLLDNAFVTSIQGKVFTEERDIIVANLRKTFSFLKNLY